MLGGVSFGGSFNAFSHHLRGLWSQYPLRAAPGPATGISVDRRELGQWRWLQPQPVATRLHVSQESLKV